MKENCTANDKDENGMLFNTRQTAWIDIDNSDEFS